MPTNTKQGTFWTDFMASNHWHDYQLTLTEEGKGGSKWQRFKRSNA
jgi:hypothetical protein